MYLSKVKKLYSSFKPFSEKQLTALTWWCPSSPHKMRDAIICDGAVRSGKTLCMSISFIAWAFSAFDGTAFAICGKTVTSLKRNVITPLLPVLRELGFECTEKVSKNLIEISFDGRANSFYLFGGKDESSASLIQGMTLGGVLLDEVALMPRSFVEQALARCSVEGSKFWFNCNPDNPLHWFHEEWIKKSEEKNCLYLHFLMQDNPSLTRQIMERYRSLYSGSFYERFVEGKWVAVQGLVYPFFCESRNVCEVPGGEFERYCISCDYGTVNPASFGLWGKQNGIWYRIDEYYHDSRLLGEQKTDEEHYSALEKLAGDREIDSVTVDPSAASFIECISRHGRYHVRPAKNDVLTGIRRVGDALKSKKIMISKDCTDCLREFALYCWNEKTGGDVPVKENDHAMDDLRYFVSMVISENCADSFFVASLAR